MDGPEPAWRRWAWRLAPLAVVVAAVAPWWPVVHTLPWGADSTRWVGFGALDRDWPTWVFASKHFVGYRPVTALSYVVNHALTGYRPEGYRLTDLALHAAGMLAFFALARRVVGDRAGAALLAPAFVFVHPVLEEVVPYPSRRSYLLATAFGLGALLAHERAFGGDERQQFRWAWTAGLSFFVAALSNEVAYVLLPLLFLRPLLDGGLPDGWRSPRVRDVVLAGLPALCLSTIAVAARFVVLGRVSGGYRKLFFAFVRDHTPVWVELDAWAPDRIAAALGRYLLVPHSTTGAGPLAPQGWVQDLATIGLLAWVVGFGVVEPLARRAEPRLRQRLWLSAWLLGSGAIVVLSQTWFWRQAHALVFPLALLVALVFDEALRRRRPVVDGLGVAGVVALFVLAAPYGAGAGMRKGPHALAIDGTAMIARVEAELPPAPAVIWVALPLPGPASHIARIWLDRRASGTGRDFRTLAAFGHDRELARVRITRDADGAELVDLGGGWAWAELGRLDELKRGGRLPVERLWQPFGRGGRTWFVGLDGGLARVSAEAHRPADGRIVGPEQKKDERADDAPDP